MTLAADRRPLPAAALCALLVGAGLLGYRAFAADPPRHEDRPPKVVRVEPIPLPKDSDTPVITLVHRNGQASKRAFNVLIRADGRATVIFGDAHERRLSAW